MKIRMIRWCFVVSTCPQHIRQLELEVPSQWRQDIKNAEAPTTVLLNYVESPTIGWYSVYQVIFTHIYLSIYLSVCLSVCLSHLIVSDLVYLIYLSYLIYLIYRIYLSIHPSIYTDQKQNLDKPGDTWRVSPVCWVSAPHRGPSSPLSVSCPNHPCQLPEMGKGGRFWLGGFKRVSTWDREVWIHESLWTWLEPCQRIQGSSYIRVLKVIV